MRNVLISRTDWGQDPAASVSGSFEPRLPGENLLKIQPQLVAQLTGTSFTLNLGSTRMIGAVHLQRLICDPGATIQVSWGGFVANANAWATDNLGVYDGLEYAALGRPRIFVSPEPMAASSVDVSISGGGSPLQVGYIGACEVWEPKYNLAYNWRMSYLDDSDITRLPFGSTYITLRAKRRRLSFGIDWVPDDRVYAGGTNTVPFAQGAMAIQGHSSPIIAIPFPEDTDNLERQAVWGLFSADPEISNPYYAHYATTFQIDQLV